MKPPLLLLLPARQGGGIRMSATAATTGQRCPHITPAPPEFLSCSETGHKSCRACQAWLTFSQNKTHKHRAEPDTETCFLKRSIYSSLSTCGSCCEPVSIRSSAGNPAGSYTLAAPSCMCPKTSWSSCTRGRQEGVRGSGGGGRNDTKKKKKSSVLVKQPLHGTARPAPVLGLNKTQAGADTG